MNKEDIKEYVMFKHRNQKRQQGTPFYLHPFGVAEILEEKGFDLNHQIVGLCHDLIEDTDVTYEDILKMTNKKIADAVKILSKDKYYEIETYLNDIKKHKIALMVKLADRMHNIKDLQFASSEFYERYIKESKEWYLPLAIDTVFEDDFNQAIIDAEKMREIERAYNASR